jgi:hypothetical protein
MRKQHTRPSNAWDRPLIVVLNMEYRSPGVYRIILN